MSEALQSLEAALYPIVVNINTYLSSYILVFLLIGVGLFYSIRTRFVQVRCFGEGMKKVFGNVSLRGGRQEQGMSSFQFRHEHRDAVRIGPRREPGRKGTLSSRSALLDVARRASAGADGDVDVG